MTKIVLVAEDDAFLAETISLGLREHGVETHLVRDGEEAEQFMRERDPDLLLLDLIMPKKDGYGVLQFMREKKSTVPVTILSNLSTDLTPDMYGDVQVKDYVVKSDIDEDDLWPKISRYL